MDIHPKVIDIYHGDSVISFVRAFEFGIRGVIHKATEGLAMVDHAYSVRRKTAIDAGMHWGAYHFLRPGQIAEQAKRFVAAADPTPDTLLALDHEELNGTNGSLAEARAFIESVEQSIGRTRSVVLYSGNLIKEQLTDASAEMHTFFGARRLWLAQYSVLPKWPHCWERPWLWQFTGDGAGPKPHAVPGIQDKMDINSFAGSDEQLAAEWADGPVVPAAAVA